MADYVKVLKVANLDGTEERDLSHVLDSASYEIDWLGGTGPGMLYLKSGSWESPILPRFAKIKLYTASGQDPCYVGVLYDERTAGAGVRIADLQSWGGYWLSQVFPVCSFTDQTASDIFTSLCSTYISGSKYSPYGRITVDGSLIQACSEVLQEWVFLGNTSLHTIFSRLADITGYTWGVRPADGKIFYKAFNDGSTAKTHTIGTDVENPQASHGPYWNQVVLIGRRAHRTCRFTKTFTDQEGFDAYGPHRHRGLYVKHLRSLNDMAKYAEQFFARYGVGNLRYEFTVRNQDAAYLPALYDGDICLRDGSGQAVMTERPVHLRCTLGADYSIEYRFHYDLEETAIAAEENSAEDESEDYGTPEDLDGRDDAEDLNDEERDTDSDGIIESEPANDYQEIIDALDESLREYLEEQRDSLNVDLHNTALDALAASLNGASDTTEIDEALIKRLLAGFLQDPPIEGLHAELLREIAEALADYGVPISVIEDYIRWQYRRGGECATAAVQDEGARALAAIFDHATDGGAVASLGRALFQEIRAAANNGVIQAEHRGRLPQGVGEALQAGDLPQEAADDWLRGLQGGAVRAGTSATADFWEGMGYSLDRDDNAAGTGARFAAALLDLIASHDYLMVKLIDAINAASKKVANLVLMTGGAWQTPIWDDYETPTKQGGLHTAIDFDSFDEPRGVVG